VEFVGQAILPAGGLSGRRFGYATNFSGLAEMGERLLAWTS